ncbi:synaptic vesicle glycoprotein 2C isoform X2 [Cephus cinctus]|uniref:Synaptic vesicle glycoprotein 2C isoform X2 n=1 Tax=Cephus cinctus TaxID=211228 RepID=A0AAJ7FQ77_CEPCN|nr:synaptic vesicle glycoprotein 2C isoform X2 [Cephus cinctus]
MFFRMLAQSENNKYHGKIVNLETAIEVAGMILSFHGWGFCADVFGRKPILLITFFCTWFSSFLSSLAPDFFTFTTFRFFTGIFLCGLSSTVYPYLSEFLPARNRSFIMTWTCGFIALGFLVIPALSWLILPLDINYDLGFVKFRSWRLLIIVMGLPCLFTAFILMRYSESPKFLMSKGKKEEALQVLRRMYAVNKNKSEEDYPVKDLEFEIQQNEENDELHNSAGQNSNVAQFFKLVWRQTVALFLPPYLFTTLLFCTLQFGIYGISAGMYLWVPDILNTMTAIESTNSYGLVCAAIQSAKSANSTVTESVVIGTIDTSVYKSTLILGGSYVLSYTTIGGLVKLLGQKKVLVSALFVSGFSGIGMYFTSSDVFVRVFMTLLVILSGTNISVLSATIVDLYPTNLRAMAVSLALTSGRLGTSVVGNIIGILIERNCTVAIIGVGSVVLVCGFLCVFIPNPRNQGKSDSRNENCVTMEEVSRSN